MIEVSIKFSNFERMSPAESRSKPAVLVIDDEKDILDVVKTCLEAEGFTVHTAWDPSEGIKLYEQRCREISLAGHEAPVGDPLKQAPQPRNGAFPLFRRNGRSRRHTAGLI